MEQCWTDYWYFNEYSMYVHLKQFFARREEENFVAKCAIHRHGHPNYSVVILERVSSRVNNQEASFVRGPFTG
jgi:hypothetical protein